METKVHALEGETRHVRCGLLINIFYQEVRNKYRKTPTQVGECSAGRHRNKCGALLNEADGNRLEFE